nr:MAG TPA: Abi-like protein [Caudoviricetes sp.]
MLQDHINNISLSRLSTYLDHFYLGDPNKLPEAVALYTAIQHRSGIFFSLIQEIEVAMRNAIADCLRQHSPNHDLGAYFHFLANDAQSPLSNKGKKQLKISMANTKNENDIIANISFGFWVNLLNTQDPAMKKAFNQLFSKAFPNFKNMYFQLKQVHTFRNDLYHQDKAWNRKKVKKPEHILADYRKTYQQFERLLSKIAPHRLQLRNKAALNKHYLQLNFDIGLFNSEVILLKQNI